ncbi:hypothetical protein [Streptomyces murinus]|nr:hypothetical protein [Streptomyces murinus]
MRSKTGTDGRQTHPDALPAPRHDRPVTGEPDGRTARSTSCSTPTAH